MTLTFHSIKGTRALYQADGIRGYLRFPVKAFDGTPVSSMTIEGINLKPVKAPVVRKPKTPLTAEKIAAETLKAQKRLENLAKASQKLGL